MVLRVALIGCGRISRVHLKALQAIRNTPISVTTLVDPDIKAIERLKKLLPQQQTCKVFQNLEAANEHNNYDAAIIMVPHDLHVHYATQCILAGKHVLLEKPVSCTLQGCIELMEQAKNTQKVLMIGENSKFWPEVVRARQLIQNGVIGEPYYVQANFWESIGNDDFYDGSVPQWKFDINKVGGGIVMDGAIHWIRPLRLLLGDISKLVSVTSNPWQFMQGESFSHALLQFNNNKFGVLHCHVNDIPMEEIPFFQIFGSKGEITIHGKFEGGLTVRSKDTPTCIKSEYLGGYMNAFGPQMARFVSLIKQGQPLKQEDEESVWEGSKDVLVAMTIYKSMRTGLWEAVDINNLMS